MERNDDMKVEILGNQLKDKKIALLVTGGIAAYKIPSLVRHFRQYGAEVYVYQTEESKDYVTEKSLEWASQNNVVTKLTAGAEHLIENIDAYVIAPLTYNTLGKMANGIADNAVTTTFASALGRLESGLTSVLISPTMHGTMQNSIYKENLEKLISKGVKIIQPDMRMGKANMPDSHYIVLDAMREISKSSLKGKKILVTAGPIGGKIDDIRRMTNVFKGRLGIMIAEEAYMKGAEVRLILGDSGINYPKYIPTEQVEDFSEYREKVLECLAKEKYDIGIFSAAVADYIPEEKREGKIPSKGALNSIPLKQTTKVIEEVRNRFPELYMTTFKFEIGVSKEKLEEIARSRINQGYELVVANRGEDMKEKHNAIIMDKTGVISQPEDKKEIARKLIEILENKYQD